MPEDEKGQDSAGDGGAPLEALVRNTFDALGLDDAMTGVCETVGYEHPTDIQQRTIPLVLGGQDVIGQAKTGTGKTAAFALPIIQRTAGSKGRPACMVLVPTRELAVQVTGEFKRLAKSYSGLEINDVRYSSSVQRHRGLPCPVFCVECCRRDSSSYSIHSPGTATRLEARSDAFFTGWFDSGRSDDGRCGDIHLP